MIGESVVDEQHPFRGELQSSSPEDVLVVLAGEVDLYTAPQLHEALDRAVDNGARRVTIDFTDVSFIDSSGLAVLIGAIKRLPSPGGSLHLVCPNEHMSRIFEVTGLTGVLTLHVTREEAMGQDL
jgi:anti-sigma B factor antagonist